jgi:hypothetical protein
VRVDLREPFDKYIDSLDLLTRKGLSVLLIIPFAEPYMVARDATRRPGRGSIFSVAPLSQLDPEYFREKFGGLGTKSSGVAYASRRSRPAMKLTGPPSMAISGFYRRRDSRRKARRARLRCMIATPICAGLAATSRQWLCSNSFATPASTIVTLKSSQQASH